MKKEHELELVAYALKQVSKIKEINEIFHKGGETMTHEEKIKYFNEDCMIGMARYPDKHFDLAIVNLYSIKPFSIPHYIGKIPSICLKWNISRREHAVDLGNMHIHLTSYFRLIRYCFTQLDSFFIILYALFIIVCTAKGINPKVKSFRHVAVEQISDLACIKANKGEYINLAIIVTLCIVFTATLDIENIGITILRSLRNDPRCGCGFYLNPQQAFPGINQNIIWQALFTWESNKPFHNKVGAGKIFASFSNLKFITCSHF